MVADEGVLVATHCARGFLAGDSAAFLGAGRETVVGRGGRWRVVVEAASHITLILGFFCDFIGCDDLTLDSRYLFDVALLYHCTDRLFPHDNLQLSLPCLLSHLVIPILPI